MKIPHKGTWDTLLCPGCQGEYLHHDTVDVFNRSEDADIGQHVRIPNDGTLSIDAQMTGNPSVRRHRILIGFWCELCFGCFSLSLAQHKGMSFLEWDSGSNH